MKRRPVDKYTGPTTTGIDVSRWQGKIDWSKVTEDNDKPRFVIVRSGDVGREDRNFVENVNGARGVGLRVGSYQYFRADLGGKEQAAIVERLWHRAGGFRAGEDLPPALDIEEGARQDLLGGIFSGGDLPLALVIEEALEFQLAIDHAFGVRPLVYGGQALHWWLSQQNPHLAVSFAEFPLWLASYSRFPLMPVSRKGEAFPWKQWTIWQYTADGRIDGIQGDVDVNVFRGDEAALASFCSASKVC